MNENIKIDNDGYLKINQPVKVIFKINIDILF
jgi:hypothetical protein